MTEELGFSTRAIHAGPEADPAYNAVTPPIYATSTYKQDGVGGTRGGYEYSRSANPTRTVLEETLASLEGGRHGLALASGLAAEDAVLRAFTGPDGHCVVPHDAYGGTYRLFARVYDAWGVRTSPVDLTDLEAVQGRDRAGADHGRLGGDADEPAAQRRRHRGAWPRSPTRPGRCSSSTTPSPRPTCSSR